MEKKNHAEELEDADKCIELAPAFYKGYYRKAMALAAMERYQEAEQVFRMGMEHCPDQKQALRKELKVMNEQARKKRQRGQNIGASSGTTSRVTDAAAWANGLSKPDQYEWLSNCYEMRCDDDYAWGGCNLHGPYDPEATPESIQRDFMAFCLLAKRQGVLPAGWNWSAFLKVAAQFVVFAFESRTQKSVGVVKMSLVQRWEVGVFDTQRKLSMDLIYRKVQTRQKQHRLLRMQKASAILS